MEDYTQRVERILGINQPQYPYGKPSPCCNVEIKNQTGMVQTRNGEKRVTKYFCSKCFTVLKTKIPTD